MKKQGRSICTLVTTLAILMGLTGNALAAKDTINNIEEESVQQLEIIKNDILEVNGQLTEDLHYIQTIEHVDVLKNTLKEIHPQISDYELGRNILLALGDSEEFIASLPHEKVVEAIQYTSVVIDEVYLHELPNGELVQISKERFYEPVEGYATADLPDYSQTFGDIILRSKAYKRLPPYGLEGRNYWSIRGEVEWVGLPNFVGDDLLVIASTGNIDNNYDHDATGRWANQQQTVTDTGHLYDSDGGDGDYLTLTTSDMYGMGVEFPVGVSQERHVPVEKVFAYYGVSSQSDITAQVSYAHAILAWNPSFSINSKGAVSFGGLSVQRQTFYGDAFTLYYE